MAKKVVKKAAKKSSKKKQIKLNIGCGMYLAPGFINVDYAFTEKDLMDGWKTKKGLYREVHIGTGATFVQANVLQLPFKDNFADYIETTDMIEHLPYKQVPLALKELFRVLKPGGEIRIETVNFDEIARLWVRDISNNSGKLNYAAADNPFFDLQEVVYGTQIDEGQYHKAAFNPQLMDAIMRLVGFKDIVIEVYPTGCGEQPKMQAQQPWYPGAVIRVEEFIAIATKH